MRAELAPLFAGADVVVHLAWRIQPSHRQRELWETNVHGSARVFEAAAAAGVGALIHGSSVGVYSPGSKEQRVDESWPRNGVQIELLRPAQGRSRVAAGCDRSREPEAAGRAHPARASSSSEKPRAESVACSRGPLLPTPLLRPGLLRAVPDVPGLRVQAVHADDVARAYLQAVVRDVHGAFNVAAEPVLDAAALAAELGARTVPIPVAAARALTAASWRLHLQPSPPGWLDLALGVPLMACDRARDELGWEPQVSSLHALLELLAGMRERRGRADAAARQRRRRSGPLG